MPYLFKTQAKISPFHGRGVYALEKIPKGSAFWVYEHETGGIPMLGCDETMANEVFTEETFPLEKDAETLKQILHGGFLYEGGPYFIYLRDGSHYTNHSINCNSQIVYPLDGNFRKSYSIANKDIEQGEEITENYNNYLSTSDWISKLMKKYCTDRYQYEEIIKKGNLNHQES